MPPAKRRLVPQPVLVVTCHQCGCRQTLPFRFSIGAPALECRRCLQVLPPLPATQVRDSAPDPACSAASDAVRDAD